jgi:hypothetical protein
MRLRLKRKPSDDDIAGPSKRYKEEQSEDEGYNEDDVDVVGSDDEVDNLSDEEDANAVDDEDDEDDASVADDKPYDEATEAFPARAAFDKDLQALEEKTVASARMLRKTLDEHSAVSETLQNMKSKLDDAVQPPNPEREMVALVGGTGAGKIFIPVSRWPKLIVTITGKSTFFNALTDTPQLAKAVCFSQLPNEECFSDISQLSAGESCTSVPTFYSHKLDWQNQPYAAEICYYTVEKCRKLLEDLLRQYNLYNFEPESDWTSDQRSEYSQQAETAFQTFRTLFCDQDLFSSQGDAEGSLEDHYKDSNTHELLDLMESWCEGFFADFDTEDDAGYTHHEADTVDELRSYTDPLTAPNHSFDEPSLWPLVELVRIGVSSPRVLKYVTIVDLPGKVDCLAASGFQI